MVHFGMVEERDKDIFFKKSKSRCRLAHRGWIKKQHPII